MLNNVYPTIVGTNNDNASNKITFVLHTKLKRIKFPGEDMASVFYVAQALFNYGAKKPLF
jgi:hypothetical protein